MKRLKEIEGKVDMSGGQAVGRWKEQGLLGEGLIASGE